ADTKRFANMFARDWKAASDELEAAKKVADAAVAFMDNNESPTELYAEAFCAFDDAVREYRALAEPLSPGKRAVGDAASEKGGEMEKEKDANRFKGDPCNMDEVLEWARNRPMDVITQTLVELIPKKDK